ncbi:hypothetical protein C8R34_1285 [Nitrosomonas sp. Nm84]|uniref:hypothetical protein n=1 Tax=Nitrosomonas sp. Nm84 TaxID=200124 RepID=UPI000D76BBC7|nr:hypothetical protein [Nitrosomonas sp. Nm84]PXW83443.1 hypothetical protein C8R34_1285 [Nitrosomonas sp. Nm84]
MNNGIYYAAGNGDDWVVAASKSDILIGDAGNDAFDGKGGGDYLEGGTGTDTDTFSSYGQINFYRPTQGENVLGPEYIYPWNIHDYKKGHPVSQSAQETAMRRDKAESGSAVWLV